MSNPSGISIHELAFVRDVLIPRVWVRGPEVDELVALRGRIDQIFASLNAPPAPGAAEEAPARTKKPRHPKPGVAAPSQTG